MFAILALVFTLAGQPVYGQNEGSGIAVSPVKTNLKAEPGERLSVDIDVGNNTDASLNLSVVANDFTSTPEAGGEPQILIDKKNEKFGLSGWFTSSPSLSVAAGQRKTYMATFSIPRDAADRTYYGIVRFQSSNAGTQTETTASVGSIIFIDVGNPTSQAEIAGITYDETAAGSLNGLFTVPVENKGTKLASGSINLTVQNQGGTVVETLEPETSGSVLPESTRNFTFKPTKQLPSEKLSVKATWTDESGQQVSKETTIDRTPTEPVATTDKNEEESSLLPILAAAGAGLLLLVLAVVLMIKKRRNKPAVTPADVNSVQQPEPASIISPSSTPPVNDQRPNQNQPPKIM